MKNNLPDKQTNFLLYTGNDGKVNVEVLLKDETIWLTQKAIVTFADQLPLPLGEKKRVIQ